KDQIFDLQKGAKDCIIILPGGGIRSNNVDVFISNGFKEVHSACVDVDAQLDLEELENLLNKLRITQ
ncbi:MAG TPA: hypothetical protein PKD85_18385, partial [Saprospiraceae bacterium]|nr:hypothetical protein [Saprospiraceae bacterium]